MRLQGGDLRGTFTIVKQLCGIRPRPPRVIKLKNGALSHDEASWKLRWTEHFAEVLNGTIVPDASSTVTTPERATSGHVDVSPWRMRVAIQRLGRVKGLGLDSIPAELLHIGRFPLAVKLSELCTKIVLYDKWPYAWKGGRVVDLYKGKGDPMLCDASRGLLISDHMGKAFVSVLKDEIEGPYTQNMPECQHGGIWKLGTDMAHHFVISAMDYAAVNNLSIFVLFLDLVKAFDKIVREIVVGWPQHCGPDRIAYLKFTGIPEESAKWIFELIESQGPLFHQWGITE